ncbi:cytochrome c oxidase subunit 2 [Tanacetum coccineum]
MDSRVYFLRWTQDPILPPYQMILSGAVDVEQIHSFGVMGDQQIHTDHKAQVAQSTPLPLPLAPLFLLMSAEPWQLGSQDTATPMMQGITDLHHDIFFFLILILVFVSRILVHALWHFQKDKNPILQRIVHGTTIEILQTIFPSIISMFTAIPSFALLYSMDEVVVNPAINIKSIRYQWYRSAPLYEFPSPAST